MKDTDEVFKGLGPGKAPATLDRKVEALLDAAEKDRVPKLRAGIPAWACLLACLISAFAGYRAKRSETSPTVESPVTVVQVERPSPELARLLDRTRQPPPYPLRGNDAESL